MADSIDLSLLPPPDVVESLNYETILAAIQGDFETRFPEHPGFLESDPAQKLLELVAYLALALRQRVNDASRQVMLAYASGTNLENLGALLGVSRLTLEAADPDAIPPVEAVMESDSDYRQRIQAALEGFSTAGPVGAYRFHARTVAQVKDVAVTSPIPGDVLVSILSRDGDGTPDQDLLDAVTAVLNADDVRPLTDNLTVQVPTIKTYEITAEITTLPGPESAEVISAAQTAVSKLASDNHKLGRDITFSGLYAALHQGGVHRVNLTSPVSEIINSEHEAAFCTAINLTHGGVDE